MKVLEGFKNLFRLFTQELEYEEPIVAVVAGGHSKLAVEQAYEEGRLGVEEQLKTKSVRKKVHVQDTPVEVNIEKTQDTQKQNMPEERGGR